MIPINEIQFVNNGQPQDLASFAATSRISELSFQPGSLHLRHSKETVWGSVSIGNPPVDQQATFWIIAKINGQWTAAGMERLRPNQQDKPEGNDPLGFIAGFVEGRNFGAFNGHTFTPGESMGFLVVQGDSRLGNNCPLRERSLIVEMAYPPNGTILWTEGDAAATPLPDTTTPLPAVPPPVPYGDLQDVLRELADIKTTLGTVATKQDIIDARKDFANAAKEIGKQLAGGALGGIFGRREAPPKKKAAKK